MSDARNMQQKHEAAISALLTGLRGHGQASDWALVRALIHKAIHFAAESNATDYCALSTFMAEMIGHSHGVMHPKERLPPTEGVH